MRILYVEDNLTNVSLVKRVARNHTVISYIDGEEALKNFARDDPDLVLMDIQLAGPLNGLQVVEKLRADGYTLPIVAVTAYAMLGDRERCVAAGCDDYIAKPLPIPTLVEMIARFEKISAERRAKQPKPPDATHEMPKLEASLEEIEQRVAIAAETAGAEQGKSPDATQETSKSEISPEVGKQGEHVAAKAAIVEAQIEALSQEVGPGEKRDIAPSKPMESEAKPAENVVSTAADQKTGHDAEPRPTKAIECGMPPAEIPPASLVADGKIEQNVAQAE